VTTRRGEHTPAHPTVPVLHEVAAARGLDREEDLPAPVAPDTDDTARGSHAGSGDRDEGREPLVGGQKPNEPRGGPVAPVEPPLQPGDAEGHPQGGQARAR